MYRLFQCEYPLQATYAPSLTRRIGTKPSGFWRSSLSGRYQANAPKLATWAEEALPQGFTVFSLPASHRRRLRTTNLIERVNQEIKRRTRVARLFPNEASCLRLVSAVLMEIAEDWQTADKRYVTFGEECAVEG